MLFCVNWNELPNELSTCVCDAAAQSQRHRTPHAARRGRGAGHWLKWSGAERGGIRGGRWRACAAAWIIVSISSVSSTYLPRGPSALGPARGGWQAHTAGGDRKGWAHLIRSAESRLPLTNL